VDPRLPGGGGYVVTRLYDINPNKFGQFNNLIRPASDFGVSDVINLTMNARFRTGAVLSGGLDTGRTVAELVVGGVHRDQCSDQALAGPQPGGRRWRNFPH
jgi:hypothetical protein